MQPSCVTLIESARIPLIAAAAVSSRREGEREAMVQRVLVHDQRETNGREKGYDALAGWK